MPRDRPQSRGLHFNRDDAVPNEIASSHVAAVLIRQGYRAASLKGGIVEWLEAKLPTETKDAPQMAPPAPGALKG